MYVPAGLALHAARAHGARMRRVPLLLLTLALVVPQPACGGPTHADPSRAPLASTAPGPSPTATAPTASAPTERAALPRAGGRAWPPVGERVTHTDAAWRRLLTPAQYEILREHGTEPAGSGEYAHHHAAGVYACAGCGAPLFRAADKFESGTGWPSFTRPFEPGRVTVRTDTSYGMIRRALACARCDGHLGHVFDDGPPPTGQRHCIDSLSLAFVPD